MSVMELTTIAPHDQQSGTGLDDQEALFRRFLAGTTFGVSDVESILADACIDIASVETISFGYFRKIVARIRLTDNRIRFAKIALHPHAVRLLKREAKALHVARINQRDDLAVPEPELRVLGPDRAIAVLSPMPGSPLSSVSVFRPPACPFPPSGRMEPLAVHMDRLWNDTPVCDESQRMGRAIARLAQRTGVNAIPVSPAHGDFVYWNVLRDRGGRTSTLDFEDYKPTAIAAYDRFYWHILPLTRFCIRRGLGAAQTAIIVPLARWIWTSYRRSAPASVFPETKDHDNLGQLALALTLAEHSSQMLREHEMVDIRSLIGGEALALRCAIIGQYQRLTEQLAQ